MKLAVMDSGDVVDEQNARTLIRSSGSYKIIAWIEGEPPEKPKKTVVKEGRIYPSHKGIFSATEYYDTYIYPQKAKNVKLIYEIEEEG
jgi:hypothetical protein